MRSSDRPRPTPEQAGRWVAVSVAVVAAVAVGYARPRLADDFHQATVGSDVYALPSPEQTIVASLGWRSATADLIYAHVLVSYGLHIHEKRRFEFAGNYLDTINALDPKFRGPYRYADTLLTLGSVAPRFEDYVKAREVLERGMDELPLDAELWSAAGQFMAYLAPSQIKDEAVKKEWRLAGARRMAKACELVGKNENIPYHCITAAGIFTRAGEREATIQFLERVLAVVDDEEIRRLALGYLEKNIGERERDQVESRVQRFMGVWGKDLPFVSKDQVLVLGPPGDPARCAGGVRRDAPECAATWYGWGERLQRW